MKRKIICQKCGEKKYLKDFPKDKRTKTGISKYCADCLKKKQKKNGNGVEITEPSVPEHQAFLACPHCGEAVVLQPIMPVPKSPRGDTSPTRKQLHKRPYRSS